MSCLEHICPVAGCDIVAFDNDPSTHYCPRHGERMVMHCDEREEPEDREEEYDVY